ncbi:MAG: S9 family peptidase [Cyclobacteriaceae bacterium]|nr:S9 family peptidase [Cyclobacteriaceae bacterium]
MIFKSTTLILSAALAFQCTMNKENKQGLAPPTVAKHEKIFNEHGHTRIDNYYWLNQREDTAVLNYLNAENNYLDKVMEHTKPLQEKLYDEIVGRIKKDDSSVPYFKNGYWYYAKFVKGGEYPIYCRKKESLENKEEIMLDGNAMAEGHSYFQIGGFSVSPDNNILVYGVDTVSRRKYTLYFKNLETGKILEETIPTTTGGASWANDNETIFFTTKDDKTLRSDKAHRYKVGQPNSKEEVYFEEDDTFYTGIYKSLSGKFLILWSGSTLTSDYRILNADTPWGEFVQFTPRVKGHEYSVEHHEEQFYISTNKEGATNFKLMATPDNVTDINEWKEVIAHRPETLLEGVTAFKDFLVIEERTNGLNQIRIRNFNTKQEHYINFEEQAYMAYTTGNREYNTSTLRFGYESMTTPESTFDYDMNTQKKELKKQQEVIGDFNPANYVTERIFATVRDGVKVPISLVYRKGITKDGANPTLLYGYGSYGSTIDPYFSSVRLSLLDRGFVYAIAHVRGGQMMGRQWYEDGKMFKKKNTFFDFNDCAKFLMAEGYAAKDKLFAMGGSAGGLLMGAIINYEPELYKGIVAAVPFVDVVTTMMDETIPLTTGEYDEWGNPNNKDAYEYILSYSPYDNVEAKAYPNMLVTTGLHDSQVQYFEPAKWVAKLRELKTDNNILLMHTNMKAGHGGASGRFERYKTTALEYAFILDLAGIKE